MNQRATSRGRPFGTDGSDFSYRMVVVSIAKAKCRLAKLIFAQKKGSPDRVLVSSLAIGFVSVVAGELGRKKSRSNFLKFYVFGSSMAIVLSVAYLATNNLQLEAFQTITSLETLKIAAVLLGFVIQLFVIGTTISIIKNMALPKRAS
ncbi:unnamed protein product [Withania somnifera]